MIEPQDDGDEPWLRQFLAGRQAKEERTRSLVIWGCFPFLVALLILLALSVARAADRPEKPSAAFCLAAKAAVVAAGSEKAAEDVARAQGFSEATIAKAKRCSR